MSRVVGAAAAGALVSARVKRHASGASASGAFIGGREAQTVRRFARAGLRPVSGVTKHLKGLILAQNERWWRGLGMQVVREGGFGPRTAANGVVRRRYVPWGPG